MPLPSLQVVQLYCLICSVAGKQQVVAWFDGQGKAHEESAVDTHGCTAREQSAADDEMRDLCTF